MGALGRSNGLHLLALARGVDERAVVPERAAKSIGHEQTFPHDLHDHVELGREVVRMGDATAARLRALGLQGRTVTLKLRFGTFATISRSSTPPEPLTTANAIIESARLLLHEVDVSAGVRLLGVSISNLSEAAPLQLTLDVDDGGGTGEWDDCLLYTSDAADE